MDASKKSKAHSSSIQVPREHYFHQYDDKNRFINYWYQISYCLELKPASVLETGVGNKFVYNYLKTNHFNIKSLDFDPELKPDYTGDIRDFRPGKEFEMVLCCEVLEHLPLDDLPAALETLSRLSSKYVLISLPQRILPFLFQLKLPKLPVLKVFFHLPRLPRVKFSFDGQHHWELETKGASKKIIFRHFRESGFEIVRSDVYQDDFGHRFILLKKRGLE